MGCSCIKFIIVTHCHEQVKNVCTHILLLYSPCVRTFLLFDKSGQRRVKIELIFSDVYSFRNENIYTQKINHAENF